MTNQNKNNISIPIAIVIAGIIIAGAVVYSPKSEKEINNKKAVQDIGTTEEQFIIPVSLEDHIRGDKNAPVTIVEFSDFQCPFCNRFHPTVKQVLAEYSGKVRWVYKHFPLDSIHPQARPAAEASECAAEQNKFWEFTDGLFENQSRLGESLYKELAQDLGLNTSKFESCLSSRKYKDKVEADYQEGIKLGISGTPGGFVNGEEIQGGAVSYSTLKTMIDRALSDFEPIGEVKEFDILAKNWEFQPNTIAVNQGDTVKLRIKSIDVVHGFGLSPESGIDIQDVRLEPGETMSVEFVANKKGTFMFACTVLCGRGHDKMTGQLIVK